MKKTLPIALITIAAMGAIGWFALRPNPDALLSIMTTTCFGSPAHPRPSPPCVKTDQTKGYVILKDRKGSRHYLLLPIQRLPGIESSVLLADNVPNFFALAWENRKLLSADGAGPRSDEDVILAINSEYGRSQNQLHIHISCAKRRVRERLAEAQGTVTDMWSPLENGLEGHDYWIRRVTQAQLDSLGAFRLLASGLPQAWSGMGYFSLAMTEVGEDIILLATERNLLDLHFASAEELQDQNCSS